MYLPFYITVTYGIGCVISIYLRKQKGSAWVGTTLVPVAAGFIIGEALPYLVYAIIKAADDPAAPKMFTAHAKTAETVGLHFMQMVPKASQTVPTTCYGLHEARLVLEFFSRTLVLGAALEDDPSVVRVT